MHLDEAIKLFKLLPVDPNKGITVSAIVSSMMNSNRGAKSANNEEANLKRRVQHYINELQGFDTGALVERLEDGRAPKYYLNLKNVARWFMSEEAALNIIFTRQVIGDYFLDLPELNIDQLSLTADSVIQESSRILKNISNRVRMVPDGIRRLKAHIHPDVLQAVYKSIGSNMQLEMKYESSTKNVVEGIFNPYGLLAKDGTLYLLAEKNSSGQLRSYPIHRVKEAKLISSPAIVPPTFDIDAYIVATGNLSHVLHDETQPIELVLKVEAQTIYHFQERPLAENQTIKKLSDKDIYIVKATIPNSLLLVPFLLSMGGWFEVVSPESVRDEVVARLKKALANYS